MGVRVEFRKKKPRERRLGLRALMSGALRKY